MTIYNAAPFLRESVDSLIAQTFQDWELIAIENGSTDASPTILAGYSDPRIRIVPFIANIGRTPALRAAFDLARGEYIAILDADDISSPVRFEKEVSFLDRNRDAVLVGTWARHIDERGHPVADWEPPVKPELLFDRLGYLNPIVHSSAMYRREAAAKVGGYPQEYVYAQDFALILALARVGRIAMLGEHLCSLRVMSGRMTRSSEYRSIIAREELLLMRHAADTLRLSPEGRRCNRRTVGKCELRYGRLLLLSGQLLPGTRLVMSGLLHLAGNR